MMSFSIWVPFELAVYVTALLVQREPFFFNTSIPLTSFPIYSIIPVLTLILYIKLMKFIIPLTILISIFTLTTIQVIIAAWSGLSSYNIIIMAAFELIGLITFPITYSSLQFLLKQYPNEKI